MGVDYYNCHECDAIFPDCGTYYYCASCDEMLCESCGEDGDDCDSVAVCAGCGCACKSRDSKMEPVDHSACKCPCKTDRYFHTYDGRCSKESWERCVCKTTGFKDIHWRENCKCTCAEDSAKPCQGGCSCAESTGVHSGAKICDCNRHGVTFIAICSKCVENSEGKKEEFEAWIARKAGFKSFKHARKAHEKEMDEDGDDEPYLELKIDPKTRRVRLYQEGEKTGFASNTAERFYLFDDSGDEEEKEDEEEDDEKQAGDEKEEEKQADDEEGEEEETKDKNEEPPAKKQKISEVDSDAKM